MAKTFFHIQFIFFSRFSPLFLGLFHSFIFFSYFHTSVSRICMYFLFVTLQNSLCLFLRARFPHVMNEQKKRSKAEQKRSREKTDNHFASGEYKQFKQLLTNFRECIFMCKIPTNEQTNGCTMVRSPERQKRKHSVLATKNKTKNMYRSDDRIFI